MKLSSMTNYHYYYGCTVEVALPWEPNTYIPQKSVVHINCTAETSQNPGWSIQPPGRSGTLQQWRS